MVTLIALKVGAPQGTAWMCPRTESKQGAGDGCDFDICSKCKVATCSRRQLSSEVKQAIFNCIPNVDADPFEHVSPPEEEWNKYYTVEDSKLSVRDIALEVKVSLESLLMYNGDIGLQPQSRLRRGTTLWIPESLEYIKECEERKNPES